MSWNVRGINKKNKQMSILDVCRVNKIGIGALLETKIKGDKLKDVMETSFQGWNYYNSMRLEGRILLIWKDSWVKVEVIKDHYQFLHCKVRFCITGQEFCLTVVYGSNQLEARKLLWSELTNMSLSINPWLIIGYFNAAFDPSDRRGGRCISKKELEDARNWLDVGLVEEMKLLGSFYTWSNNQEGDNRIYSKLDRVFVNEDWLDIFPSVIAAARWEVTSDHCVIILKQTSILNEAIAPFQFYNMWTSHPQFRITALSNWNKDLRTKGCGLDQISWKLIRLKNFEDSKAEYQKAKSDLFSDPQNQNLSSAERISFLRFKNQEKIYGSFLRKKSKIEWLQFGNENSSYFHAYMKQRKRANRITSYMTEDGRVEDSYPKVINHFVEHFKTALGCPNKATGNIDSITDLGSTLSVEDQLALIKPFSSKDVKAAMFSISSIKSLGPDGFGAGFFKSLWKDIRKEVAKAILDFFETGYIPKAMNNTILTLIPKIDHPNIAADFRPIAYCITLYKCISKMLCHRMIGILPKLINQNQGAFIKDRTLAHNVLILHVLLKGYKMKHSSPRCLLKIDLSKAYDSIDWDFLENLLKALRFPGRFIRWIMICLRGASYCLMLNGCLHGSFQGGKGLRQGDPISPLLFVIVMEYLTRSIFQAAKGKGFKFHPLCKSLNIISLYFADDFLVLCKANTSSIQIIQHALDEFSAASGLLINKSKSRAYFGGVSVHDKPVLLNISNLVEGEFPLTYLGLPLRPTKWKAMDCDLILKKIRQRLCVWASRNLSYAGRVQLIQSVLLGIRNYWMSIFLLPQSILKEIDHLCRLFLWGGKGNRRKFHLTSWEQVCCPKSHGGLGFKEGPLWNQMLLTKFIWAISSKQDLLWVKWVNFIYLKGTQIWDYNLHHDSSWYWKKLIKISKVLSFSLLDFVSANGKLILSRIYHLFLPSSPKPIMKAVWCSISVPNHKFILWQSVHQKLPTRDMLLYCHIPLPSLMCLICDQEPESHSHLFFECVFSKRVVQSIFEWLHGLCWPSKFSDWCNWLEADMKSFKDRITLAVLEASIYYIWYTRNRCYFDSSCLMIPSVISLIKSSVIARILVLSLDLSLWLLELIK
ncbi:uncharacterized protein LOC133824478 [Humulus lupulus]|uniref:uncharacterized protein LOC133824478 n=1 Tax=Humulus lupulus TaxID=3486 RepID=UPI002B41074E|nr:uncharacterized protein LOC133824478 [Humulus lupulus]